MPQACHVEQRKPTNWLMENLGLWMFYCALSFITAVSLTLQRNILCISHPGEFSLPMGTAGPLVVNLDPPNQLLYRQHRTLS